MEIRVAAFVRDYFLAEYIAPAGSSIIKSNIGSLILGVENTGYARVDSNDLSANQLNSLSSNSEESGILVQILVSLVIMMLVAFSIPLLQS